MIIVRKEVSGMRLLHQFSFLTLHSRIQKHVSYIVIEIQHIKTAFRTKCQPLRDVMTDKRKVR